jgi:D-glycero-D-manno-heptose 1,7-bisphosphate phosphatase
VKSRKGTKKGRGERAVFLDRDGTLIREVGYLRDPSQIDLEQDALEAVSLLNQHGFPVVLVTNQSGIARGFYTERELMDVHAALGRLLAVGNARLDGLYYCPHHPEGVVEAYRRRCRCRKPGIGLVERAARDMHIDLSGSYFVGDKRSDMELAGRAGLTGILVKTGYGERTWRECLEDSDAPKPDRVCENLREAVDWILWVERTLGGPHEERELCRVSSLVWNNKWVPTGFLKKCVDWHREQGQIIVVANGVFDILHAGHVGHLKAAKELGDVLIVAVNDDRSVRYLKGAGRPVFPLSERIEIISALACVDYCVAFWAKTADEILDALRPDFHAKGVDYTEASVPERETVIGYGGQVRIVGPTKEHGTTDILERIRDKRERQS